MTDEFLEKIFNILLDISKSVRPISFWADWSFWLAIVGCGGLFMTLYFLIKSTSVTERMAGYQIMPAIDVNMIYEKNLRKTYFWFSNGSNMPGFVSIKVIINKNQNVIIGPLRIPPNNITYLKKTATHYDFLSGISSDELEIVLDITVTPAFKKTSAKFTFEKSYRFDRNGFQWNETSWSYPDPSFPFSDIPKI